MKIKVLIVIFTVILLAGCASGPKSQAYVYKDQYWDELISRNKVVQLLDTRFEVASQVGNTQKGAPLENIEKDEITPIVVEILKKHDFEVNVVGGIQLVDSNYTNFPQERIPEESRDKFFVQASSIYLDRSSTNSNYQSIFKLYYVTPEGDIIKLGFGLSEQRVEHYDSLNADDLIQIKQNVSTSDGFETIVLSVVKSSIETFLTKKEL